MDLPPCNASYKDVEYWDSRYKVEQRYDWLADYGGVKHLLEDKLKKFKKDAKILHLGCGNSSLPLDLYKDGWTNITNIDISEVVVDRMKEQHRQMDWITMDMTNMTFSDDTFDIVLEKATLDSLLVEDKSPWAQDTPGKKLVVSSLREVARVMKTGGMFVSITFTQPHFRVPLLCSPGLGWSVEVEEFSRDGGFPFYHMAMEEGDPGPALDRFSIRTSCQVEEGSGGDSSGDENFVNNFMMLGEINSDIEEEDLSR